jgi:hypothetical protein
MGRMGMFHSHRKFTSPPRESRTEQRQVASADGKTIISLASAHHMTLFFWSKDLDPE